MNQELQKMLSDLDAVAGEIDRKLAAAESYTNTGRLDLAMPHVNAAHDATARFGRMLAEAARWNQGGQIGAITGQPQPQLRPGQVLADAGSLDGQYTGDVDEATLTDENRRYISRHVGDFSAHWGQVFNAKVRFSSLPGNLANGPESPILADGRSLADIVARL